jgi:hypothetical protein
MASSPKYQDVQTFTIAARSSFGFAYRHATLKKFNHHFRFHIPYCVKNSNTL